MSLEDEVFEVYKNIAYPHYLLDTLQQAAIRAGLRAVIKLLKKEGLS